MNKIHIFDLQNECEALCTRIATFEQHCHAYTADCIQDLDQGQETEVMQKKMWRSLKDISTNSSTARASLQITRGICEKLCEEAVNSGVWE